ncbi:hypothetical protein MJO10_21225, partial [Salmonella enterica subsp. enterica serovar Anatum]|nr:hypothetical protein [Salmonella enterica subsp. enterica serovar Anatum]
FFICEFAKSPIQNVLESAGYMPVRTAVYPDMGWTLLQTYDLAYSPDIAKSSIMDRFCAER